MKGRENSIHIKIYDVDGKTFVKCIDKNNGLIYFDNSLDRAALFTKDDADVICTYLTMLGFNIHSFYTTIRDYDIPEN